MRRERRGVSFSEEEQELYETLFQRFSPVEFMRLLRVGRWVDADAGAVLTVQGEPVDDLILISSGRASVDVGGACVAHLRAGEFVGEMSLVTGEVATATVRADEHIRYLAWQKAALDRLLTRYASMRFAMQAVVSADLTRKLMRERE
jgi:CRP-like cAMP-binding protein